MTDKTIKAIIKGFQQGAGGSLAAELSGIGRLFADRLFTDNTDVKKSFNTGKSNYKKAYEYYKKNYPQTTKVGEVLGYGGATVAGLKGLNIARQKIYYDRLRNGYERYKLGKAFDEVNAEPLKGNREGKDDVMVTIKPSKNETYYINRGAAVKDNDGNIVVQDNPKNPDPTILKQNADTSQNFGLAKYIYKHNGKKEDLLKVPDFLRKYKPLEEKKHGNYQWLVPLNKKTNFRMSFAENQDDNFKAITMFKERFSKNRPLSQTKSGYSPNGILIGSTPKDTNQPRFARDVRKGTLNSLTTADSVATNDIIEQNNKNINRKTAKERLKEALRNMTLEEYINSR